MVLIFSQWRAAYDLCCTLLDSEVKGISITTCMGKQSRHCPIYKIIQSFNPNVSWFTANYHIRTLHVLERNKGKRDFSAGFR